VAVEDLDRWGLQIARWAAPDETVLAAQITRAYAAGGSARRELFRTGRLAPGGFGGGVVTLLPELLDALAYAAEAVKAALASQEFANAVSAAALLVSLRAQRTEPEPRPPSHPAAGADASSGQPRTSGTEPAHARTGEENAGAPPQPSADAVLAALRICGRLRARGVDTATAEELVAQLTARLLASEDPGGVAAFLDALVANEPPEPAPRGSRRMLAPVRHLTGALFGLRRRRTAPGADPIPARPPTTTVETDGP